MTVTAIVLAGGRSARFGGDKLTADLGGRSVLDRTIEAVRNVADEVIVVGRPGALPGVIYLADDAPFEGPLAGLITGLAASRDEAVLVVGGDMPRLRAEVLGLMLERLRTGIPARAGARVGAVALTVGEQSQPLPLATRRGPAVAVARTLFDSGERSLRALLRHLALDSIAEATWRALDPGGDTILDIDTRHELRAARRLGRAEDPRTRSG